MQKEKTLLDKIIELMPEERELKEDCTMCMSCEYGMSNCEIRDQNRQYNLAIQNCKSKIPEILSLIRGESKKIAFGKDMRGRSYIDLDELLEKLK